jgi:hypothetical protein
MLDNVRQILENTFREGTGVLINPRGLVNSSNRNNQLVLFDKGEQISAEIESNLYKFCKNLELNPSSFSEAFPNYNGTEGLYPIKLLK